MNGCGSRQHLPQPTGRRCLRPNGNSSRQQSKAVKPRWHSESIRIDQATFGIRRPVRGDCRPVGEIGGRFQYATSGQIACRNKLPAALLNIGRGLGLEMQSHVVLPATIRSCGVMNKITAVRDADEVIAQEPARMIDDAADVFPVISPRAFARAELGNAATLSVHGRARRRVRTLIKVVGNAIVIGVAVVG